MPREHLVRQATETLVTLVPTTVTMRTILREARVQVEAEARYHHLLEERDLRTHLARALQVCVVRPRHHHTPRGADHLVHAHRRAIHQAGRRSRAGVLRQGPHRVPRSAAVVVVAAAAENLHHCRLRCSFHRRKANLRVAAATVAAATVAVAKVRLGPRGHLSVNRVRWANRAR